MNKNQVVGGQALIEGVMMRNGTRVASALRLSDGSIAIKDYPFVPAKHTFWKFPVIRGIFALGQALKTGMGVLSDSAAAFGAEEEESSFDRFLKKTFGEKKAEAISMAITMLISLGMAILFFMVLPTLIVGLFKPVISSRFILSLLEGLLKMVLFLAYILLISRMKEIKRVFMYHGAEHKAVFNFESGEELTVENARKFSRLHPRCGTSFMFFMIAISIVLFSVFTWESVLARVGLKVLFMPIIAGLGYELLRFSALDSKFFSFLKKPGMWIQNITTAEPDDAQLEVALAALKRVTQ